MNKYQKSLIDFMKTGEIEIELRHLSQRELIRLVQDLQQRINKSIEKLENMKNIEGGTNSTILQVIKEVEETVSILKGEEK